MYVIRAHLCYYTTMLVLINNKIAKRAHTSENQIRTALLIDEVRIE